MAEHRQTVSLVLGSGGARGLAHIGVIRWLEAHGFDIRCIAGSSMGALVGGIHAAGKLDVYAAWVSQLERVDVLRLLDLSLSRNSLFKGERIMAKLEELIGRHEIDDLPIRFTAVATDIVRQREVWLNTGSLFQAIRASIAVPMVFAPVRRNARLLVDGGLVNPMPIAPALNDDCDLIIAVNLGAHAAHLKPAGLAAKMDDPHASQDNDNSDMSERVRGFLASLWPRGEEQSMHDNPDLVMLMSRALDCMQTQITRLRLAAYSPDAVVEIPRDLCGFFEFDRAEELIAFGEAQAGEQLARLKADRGEAQPGG